MESKINLLSNIIGISLTGLEMTIDEWEKVKEKIDEYIKNDLTLKEKEEN